MKRGMAMFWALFFLAGCMPAARAAVDPVELLGRSFSSQVQLDWEGESYSGTIDRDAQGGVALSLTGESLVIPVTFTCQAGGCVVQQGELVLTLEENDLPSASLPSSLQRAFVLLQNASPKEREGTLSLEAGAVRLLCSGDDLSFSQLTLERGGIEFTQFAFTGS